MRTLTGLRINSTLHIGNYLGGILPFYRNFTNRNPDDDFFFFVPDLHSITTPVDYNSLKSNIYSNIKSYLASGLDINSKNLYFYRQSKVPAHTQLAWVLNCFTYFGEASRMTQFKDKSKSEG